MPRTRSALLLLAALAFSAAAGPSQPDSARGAGAARYVVAEESRFWIDGTSTVDDFTCEATAVAGYAEVRQAGTGHAVRAEVVVPTRDFDCGRSAMNRDFYDALRADHHPTIRFQLDRAEVVGEAAGAVRDHAAGTLTLAGATRPVTLDAEGERLADGRVRVRGRHPFAMTAFGVEPPTALLGLVRAHDRVVVRFDLVATEVQ
ncbi:MAG: YceI family protein [Rhodothermales bacterium]|nr:YceI family protein [Rhodothermales bacterium]